MNLDPEAAPRVGLADLWREFKRLRQEVGFLRSAQGVLAAATIGRGGLVIEDGGSITVLGGSVGVTGGGSIRVDDGGRITGYYPSGRMSFDLGSLSATATGLKIRLDEDDTSLSKALAEIFQDPVLGRVTRFLNADYWTADAASGAVMGVGDSSVRVTSTGGVDLTAAVGGVTAIADGHSLQVNAAGTQISAAGTASGANVHMTGTGVLQLVGSARALKVDIGDLAPGTTDALLALTPRRFRDKAQAEDDPRGAPFILGFIADEVDAAGLTDLVTYDENGEPVAVAYDRITAPLVALVQQQQAQIDDLAAQVQALTARLDALSV